MPTNNDVISDDWEDLYIPGFTGGLNLDADTEAIQNDEFVRLENVYFHKKALKTDYGYEDSAIGHKDDYPPLAQDSHLLFAGIPRKSFTHIHSNGILDRFLVTDKGLFQWGFGYTDINTFYGYFCDFDGSTYIRRNGSLTGAADGKTGTISFWLKLDGGDGTLQYIFSGLTAFGGAVRVHVARFADNTLVIQCTNSSGLAVTTLQSNVSVTADGLPHHIVATWDNTDANKRRLLIDGVDRLLAAGTNLDQNIDYTLGDWVIGATVSGADRLNGQVGELIFHTVYLDVAIQANLEKFLIDGRPADLGTTGSNPFGVQPLVYQSIRAGESVSAFQTNRGSGGNFSTVTGTPVLGGRLGLSTASYGDTGYGYKYVNSGVESTLTVTVSTGVTSITVADGSIFSPGQPIAIITDDGLQIHSKISSIAGNVLTLHEALPGNITATSGNQVFVGIVLSAPNDDDTNTETTTVSAVSIPWNDWFVFTNNIDPIMYYDPDTSKAIELPGTSGWHCRGLAIYDNSLILVGMIEDGTDIPQRIRWSDEADAIEFEAGASGFVDLLDSTDVCLCAYKQGPYLSIYRNNSIVRGQPGADVRFEFNTIIPNQGPVNANAVAPMGDLHFLVARDGFYIYDGGYSLAPVAEKITDGLTQFTPDYVENNDYVTSPFKNLTAVYVKQRKMIVVSMQADTAIQTDEDPVMLFLLDINTWIGSIRTFPLAITGLGLIPLDDAVGLEWQEVQGVWDDHEESWLSGSQKTLPISLDLLTFAEDANDHIYTYRYGSLVGTQQPLAISESITYTVDTKDFSHPSLLTLLNYIEIKTKSTNSITIQYSTDQGQNWSAYATVNSASTPTKSRLFKQLVARTIRFRFTGTGDFELFWLNLQYRPEFEW